MATAATNKPTAPKAKSAKTLTFEDLTALSLDGLAELYAGGTVPDGFAKALDNHPKGRMVALRGIDSVPVLNKVVDAFAKHPLFPWDGKSMAATSDQTSDGINRIKVGAKMNWFPFKTSVQPSSIDGKPTIVLDYEQKGNPIFIKAIHDEIREVAPGMYLGPAMAKIGKSKPPVLVLWFALDTNK
jgi:hypothetical protein